MKKTFVALASACAALANACSDDVATGAGGDTTSAQVTATDAASTSTTGTGGGVASPFWLEPTTKTLIGVGQEIVVYPAMKLPEDAFPKYVDPSLVTWTSSAAAAPIDAEGHVVGVSDGTTKITATYEGNVAELEVEVAGAMENRSILVPGQGMRRYAIYVPPGGATTKSVLLAMHGGGGSAMLNAASTLLNTQGHAHDFYVVYPNGTGAIQTYNAGACCGSAQTNDVDDLAYIDALVADVKANFDVDASKIFSSGFSNGGMMSHRLACERADLISGIAAVSGASGQFDRTLTEYYPCVPSRPIPILHIHYDNDRNYPLEGGMGEGLSSTDYYPVEATIEDWRTRNNVTSDDDLEELSPTTRCHRYRTPANVNMPSAPVTLCISSPVDVFDPETEIVFGGGHAWPGGVRSPSPNSDTPAQDFVAGAYLWSFLNP